MLLFVINKDLLKIKIKAKSYNCIITQIFFISVLELWKVLYTQTVIITASTSILSSIKSKVQW